MAIIPMQQALELIQGYSISMLAWRVGILAGFVHHFTSQVPKQADVLTTLSIWLAGNLLFIVASFWTQRVYSVPTFIGGVTLFNLIYISTALTSKAAYNVYFRHRGIPTEFRLSLTDWGLWNYGMGGYSHLKIAELHRELGDVVRIQPNHLSFNSVKAIEDIHSTQSKARKGDFYDYIMRPPGLPSNLLNSTDKMRHSFLRRTIGPTFSGASMNAFEPVMKRYSLDLINTIQREADTGNGIIDMNDWFNRFSFDVAGELSFGEDFGAMKGGEQHFIIKAFNKYINLIRLFMFIPWLAKFILKFPPPQALKESRYKALEFSQDSIRRMRGDGSENRTIIGKIMNAVDPITGEKCSESDLIVNANVFVIAASDTTAVTLTFLLYYLLAKRQYWERLAAEIRSKFRSVDEMTNTALLAIPFLEAAINETLRVRPAVPTNLQRETPAEGMEIAGYFVPGGTVVSIPNWTVMHDERNFSNPQDFIPMRWMENEKGTETCNTAAFTPFSYGPRSCIGKPVALMELRYVSAMFIWHFDAEFASPAQGEPYYKDAFVVLRGPLPIKLKSRFVN